ncbi:putative V-type proton ATPase subunit a [Trichinella zimbabwensis]|uniref:V-type proton ATPase subunit a n=1 Tax=Trichinella zimbabwensis TaxID=268475 RepID=A0A0V1I599_9BILA|nr:putative V-type proton ATPase subunit a [Trichinella zimbabwensis]
MGSLFRSEEMCRCQLFLQTEASYACVSELGELGLVQFRDLNPDVTAFQRKFVNEIRRCDEMERKLRFLEKEIKKDRIPILDTSENPDAPLAREMIDLEATFEKLDNELREVNMNEEMLKKNFLELTELKHILRKTQAFFDEQENIQAMQSLHANDGNLGQVNPALEYDGELIVTGDHKESFGGKLNLDFVVGVILRERIPAFERLLWRACRGNVFLKQAEITESLEDPATGDLVQKSVILIFFQGEQLKSRVKKICEGFRATLYPCPETPQERREMAIGVMTRIEDLKTVLGQTQDHRHRVLVAAAKNIRIWFTKVRKIKSIYHTLNLFNLDVTQKCLIAECWCPVADLDKIQLALKRGTEESGSSVPSILNRMYTTEAPPTYNRTNKFTAGFQNIVDAYGVASYREVNPALYTIITFPFLFAIMFGDFGHGLIMFLFALFLIVKEKQLIARKIRDEVFNIFFGGRYIIFLMGLFSIYTGIVYNEVYAKSVNIFGSSWMIPAEVDDNVLANVEKIQLNPNTSFLGHAYAYGLDPAWNIAVNKLNFLNSFKMKMSVIIGVFQMLFGVVLSLFNYRFFNRKIDIYTMFIPQMLFMCCIFLYLCILIIYKWTVFSAAPADMAVGHYPGSHCAPSLLIGLIFMFMFQQRNYGFGDSKCVTNAFYPGQVGFEQFLVVVAVLCAPTMLFVKPYLIYRERKNRLKDGHIAIHADMNSDDTEAVQIKEKPSSSSSSSSAGAHDEHDDMNISEIFIIQAIHTIEFCLGCISHTASYLRLWALSLAHAQLSDVLWAMVLRIAFGFQGYAGAIAVYLIVWAFGMLTICILVLMEGLSAFLHALRLHWVEFQSKFYTGSGYLFTPFSFDVILEQARIEDGD